MSNQESMFTNKEQQPYRPQPINTDSREQASEQVFPQEEGYRGSHDGPQRWNSGKIRPQLLRRRRRSPLLAIIIGIVVIVAGFTAYGAIASSTASTTVTPHTFHVGNRPALVMNVGSGEIHVHTGNVSTVTIKETKRAAGFTTSNDKVDYSQNGNTINVQENGNSGITFGSSSHDFDVTLPGASDVQLQTGSGSIDITGVNGQVSANTSSGSVNADNLSGQQATLKTGSGSIDAHNISNQRQILSTGSGEITVSGLSGQVNADTGSGSITVSQGNLGGNSVLKTGSGSVNYNGSLNVNGNYRFETGSGNVSLTLPASSAFTLDAHSDSGSVNNAFGGNEVGSSPRAPVSISTGSGSIDINKG